ncbi:MAG: thermonuclease family protein [Methylophilaceae bacterium]
MKISIIFGLLILSTLTHAESLQGKIIGITDGDTVKLLDQNHVEHKIRLAGIDAPEKKQAFGQESKQALSDCAYDKMATIDGNKKDRYGRIVGKVMVNSTDCNLRQIKLGLAWHYKKYENEQEVEDRSVYAQEEYQAQKAMRGLWAIKDPVAPWDFRKKRKAQDGVTSGTIQ